MNFMIYPRFRCLVLVGLMFIQGVSSLSATTVSAPEFGELVNRSDYVVRARIESSAAELRISGERRRIFTRVKLEVLEVIAGEPPLEIELVMLGGRIDDEELIVDGMPRLRVGSERVLFIKDNGKVLCPIYAMKHGTYPIEEEPMTKRRYMTRGDKVPLESVAEVAQPLTAGEGMDVPTLRRKRDRAITPEEFIQSIKAARKTSASK